MTNKGVGFSINAYIYVYKQDQKHFKRYGYGQARKDYGNHD